MNRNKLGQAHKTISVQVDGGQDIGLRSVVTFYGGTRAQGIPTSTVSLFEAFIIEA